MKASELRIGNYFIGYSNHLQQWELESFELLIKGLEVDEIIRCFVPITEEWLLKFGFEVIYRSHYTLKLDHKKNLNIGAGWNLINNHFYIRFIGNNLTNIKYIHQLQNLYFALTNEELILK